MFSPTLLNFMNYLKDNCWHQCNIKLYFTVRVWSDVFLSGKATSGNTFCSHQAKYNAIFHQNNLLFYAKISIFRNYRSRKFFLNVWNIAGICDDVNYTILLTFQIDCISVNYKTVENKLQASSTLEGNSYEKLQCLFYRLYFALTHA